MSGAADVGDLLVVAVVLLVGAVLWRQGRRRAAAVQEQERLARERLEERLAERLEERLDERLARRLRQEQPDLVTEAVRAGLAAGGLTRTPAAVDALDGAVQAVTGSLEALTASVGELGRVLRDVETNTSSSTSTVRRRRIVQQVQALLALPDLGRVGPYLLGGWALSPDALWTVLSVVRSRHPRVIVETGSGVSTLHLAAAQEAMAVPGRVVSLEHDPHYAEETRRRLRAAGLEHHVDVRSGELEPVDVDGEGVPWYPRRLVEDLRDVDLLLVDGPPGDTHRLARYPAVPLLAGRLSDRCVILLDDSVREQEKEVARRWAAELPDLRVLELPLEKGMTVLYRGEPPL